MALHPYILAVLLGAVMSICIPTIPQSARIMGAAPVTFGATPA